MSCPACALREWAVAILEHAERAEGAIDRRTALGGVLYGFTEGRRAGDAPLCATCERAVSRLDPAGFSGAPVGS